MRIRRVKRYMHKTLERIKRPILTNLHKFVYIIISSNDLMHS